MGNKEEKAASVDELSFLNISNKTRETDLKATLEAVQGLRDWAPQ